ncbi:MAG: esterase [Bacteroidia bacterium]|nr:MAG: esterase [Bacteroidia bacterium]
MKSKKAFISTTKTASISLLGNPETARYFWLVLHGYGQLAENFQKHFSDWNLNEHYIILPNALNYFYLKSGKGDVGASWMTKYEREKDISDNNHYLNQVYEQLILPHKKQQSFFVIGFSQGAATLIRWLAMENLLPDKIILWGAVFPPDIEQEKYLEKLKQIEWWYFIGTEDEFISNDEKEKQKHFFQSHQFNIHWIEYEGKHAFNEKTLYNTLKL